MLKEKNEISRTPLTTGTIIVMVVLSALLSASLLPYEAVGASFLMRLAIGGAGTALFSVVGLILTAVALKLSRALFSIMLGTSTMILGLTYYSLALFPSLELAQRLLLSILAAFLTSECLLMIAIIVGAMTASKGRLLSAIAVFSSVVILFVSLWNSNRHLDESELVPKKVLPVLSMHLDRPNPSLPGRFAVRMFSYGSGHDAHRPEYGADAAYKTLPVDASPFLRGWTDRRTRYWGFDQTQLPINGRVWFPIGSGPFPLVLIVHGVHEMVVPSETGFGYLGDLLASRGYIVVSIDENFLNWDWYEGGGFLDWEIDARAWLILQHLRQWQAWNEHRQSPFFGKVDMQNIALIGHSLGGEAITLATAYNQSSCYPVNAEIHFDFRFNIRSLVALSPSDYYQPASERIPVQNVNYLVLGGNQDNDLSSFLGTRVYKRVQFTNDERTIHDKRQDSSRKQKYFFKTLLYIGHANHSQFNTAWGNYDTPWPSRLIENTKVLIPGAEQRRVAEVYISAFLDETLKQDRGYLSFFQDYRLATAWLPATTYINQFEDSTFHVISNFDEDIDPETTTLSGGKARGRDLLIWREQDIGQRFAPVNGLRENNAVYLAWEVHKRGTPYYEISLPASRTVASALKPESRLAFSLVFPAGSTALDFSIILVDQKGSRAQIPLSAFYHLEPAWNSRLTKLAWLEKPSSQKVFQSVMIPLSSFMKNNRYFEPQRLKKIIFYFDQSPYGALLLDDVGFYTISNEQSRNAD